MIADSTSGCGPRRGFLGCHGCQSSTLSPWPSSFFRGSNWNSGRENLGLISKALRSQAVRLAVIQPPTMSYNNG